MLIMKRLFVLIGLVCFTLSVHAQSVGSVGASDPWTTGTAKTYTVLARGVYALSKNPANLMIGATRKTDIALPHLNVRLGTSFASIDEFNYFFGGMTDSTGQRVGKYLNDADKERFRKLFDGGGDLFTEFSTNLIAFAVPMGEQLGIFAFNVSDALTARASIPQGLVDLALNGNVPGKTFSFNDLRLRLSYNREISFSYANNLGKWTPSFVKELDFGFSLKLVQGYGYVGLEKINTSITTSDSGTISGSSDMLAYAAFSPDFNIQYDFDSTSTEKAFTVPVFPKAAGSGLGIDIGFTAVIDDKWTAGIAICNIGSITYDQNVAEYSSVSNIYLSALTNEKKRNELVKELRGQGKRIGSFKKDLPTVLRIGVMREMYRNEDKYFVLSMDYNQGFNDEPSNSTKPRISIGGEWNVLDWLPFLRGGFSFGGDTPFIWSVGAGFSIWKMEFNVATQDFQYVFSPLSGKRLAFSGGMRIRF